MPLARRLSVRAPRVSARAPPESPAPAPDVQASSIITIVRVASPPPPRRSHQPDRLSFATTSFGPSPPSSPRPSSPHRPALPSAPRLSPDQLVNLARASTHCPPSASATFTPLPDDILLPFIDRPSEVAALIATPPSAKLFSLLEKTLAPITEPSSDPAKWSYPQLHHHLTHVSRQQASDALWVLHSRRCIVSHSELIWERVKGALGVPLELDESDYDYASSIDTDDISDDHGRSARGHWEDWDAIMDSPISARRHSGPSSPILPLEEPLSLVSIEPLLSQSHISTRGPLALDDIQESAEEQEQDLQEPDADPHLIAPSNIQGLRISTTPVSLSDLAGSVPPSSPSPPLPPQPLSPISPLPPYTYPASRSRPLSGSFAPTTFRPRSGSSGSLMSLRGGYAADHEDGYASSAASDAGHDRATKTPLFPSSFARLNAEPTLGHVDSASGASGGSVSGYKRLSWGAHKE